QPAAATFVIPGHLRSPRYQNWSLTLDQRLPLNIYFRAQGLRRKSGNSLAYFGTLQPGQDTVYTLSNRRAESYKSLDFSLRQSCGKEYGWMTGYTRSSARSNAVMDIGPDDYFIPVQNAGPLSWDAPNRIVSWAYLPTFRPKWSIAWLLDYRT